MLNLWLLRFHRWITLIFSIPLAVLILTGLVLSFEPMVQNGSARSGQPVAEAVKAAIAKHDPGGSARSLVVRAYNDTVSIGGARRSDAIHVDLRTNETISSPGFLAEFLLANRQLHEKFLLDLGWLVMASTIAMLLLIAIGITMGLPRLRNTLSGWHKGTAWFLLPLLILSPLTGLFLAFGWTFTSPPPGAASPAAMVSLREAVATVGAKYDLGQVAWIRPRGNAMLARVNDGGEMRVFSVGREGLVATPRNWPRLLHEGNWGGRLSALINVVISAAFMLLLSTGLLIWARRRFRKRRPRVRTAALTPRPEATAS
jgi:uncharacterized iron-regulated membrane protein